MIYRNERKTGWLGPIVVGLLVVGLVGGAAVWLNSRSREAGGKSAVANPTAAAYSARFGAGQGYTEQGTGVLDMTLVTETATGCQFLIGRTGGSGGNGISAIERLPCEARDNGQ